jgi:hypothetical protein
MQQLIPWTVKTLKQTYVFNFFLNFNIIKSEVVLKINKMFNFYVKIYLGYTQE